MACQNAHSRTVFSHTKPDSAGCCYQGMRVSQQHAASRWLGAFLVMVWYVERPKAPSRLRAPGTRETSTTDMLRNAHSVKCKHCFKAATETKAQAASRGGVRWKSDFVKESPAASNSSVHFLSDSCPWQPGTHRSHPHAPLIVQAPTNSTSGNIPDANPKRE